MERRIGTQKSRRETERTKMGYKRVRGKRRKIAGSLLLCFMLSDMLCMQAGCGEVRNDENRAVCDAAAIIAEVPGTVSGDGISIGNPAAASGEGIFSENPAQGPGEDVSAESPVPAGMETVTLDESWPWASESAIHTGSATLYRAGGNPDGSGRRNITVCVNAGHGCAGGSDAQTLSHPDGTPKVTGGTNAESAVYSTSISTGTVFTDGTTEASANLLVALSLKDRLLADGYDVLMIREGDDVQLDNIARSVIANNCADLHIAIHFDSTQSDKGIYFCSVPEDASYRSMEPVASMWQEHMALGQALISAFARDGYTLFDGGMLPMDLTQTSYSTIPSVDIELGDTASDHSPQACDGYAKALKDGIDTFFAS